MKYKAIGFDYGGVIGGLDTGEGSTGASFVDFVVETLGLTKKQYGDLYFSMNHLMMLGELDSWSKFWQQLCQKASKPEAASKIITRNIDYENKLNTIDQRELELADTLRVKGYKVGLLSNTTIKGAKNMRRLGVDTHFDVFFASAERKMMKPTPATFETFAKELGVQPAELIFIDDAEKSLSTAEEVGFTPILFKSYEQLKTQLQELGVL